MTRALALTTMPSLATPSMVTRPEEGLGQSMTLGLTEVLTASRTVLPVPLVARSMAQARSKSRWIPALRAAMRAWMTICTLPPARKWVDKSSILTANPDLMAVMRVSTMRPTGTPRRRSPMSSRKVTRAPAAMARNQIKKKLKMMMAKTRRTRSTMPPSRNFQRPSFPSSTA